MYWSFEKELSYLSKNDHLDKSLMISDMETLECGEGSSFFTLCSLRACLSGETQDQNPRNCVINKHDSGTISA